MCALHSEIEGALTMNRKDALPPRALSHDNIPLQDKEEFSDQNQTVRVNSWD